MKKDHDRSITLPASFIVNAPEKPVDDVRIPTHGQLGVVSAKSTNPVRHFGCTLGPAVAMKVQRYDCRSFRGMGIKPVSSWPPHDYQAVYGLDITGRPNRQVDLGNSHLAAVSPDAIVAPTVAMMLLKRSEDCGDASTFALWSSLILDEQCIDGALVITDQRRPPNANISRGLIAPQHLSDRVAA